MLSHNLNYNILKGYYRILDDIKDKPPTHLYYAYRPHSRLLKQVNTEKRIIASISTFTLISIMNLMFLHNTLSVVCADVQEMKRKPTAVIHFSAITTLQMY